MLLPVAVYMRPPSQRSIDRPTIHNYAPTHTDPSNTLHSIKMADGKKWDLRIVCMGAGE